MEHLQAGTGRADISPAPGTPQGGWGAQTHQRGLGTDMPLLATALVLSDGCETVAIADVDIISISPEVEAHAAALACEMTGIPPERIRISNTHTHSGPNTFRLPIITEGLPMALNYIESLPHRIAGAIWQAWRSMRPVRVAAGKGSCAINANRRFRIPGGRMVVGSNPEGVVDRAVRVLRFDGLDERPVATIVHYACHGTTIAWQNQYHTPDFPGVVRRVVEEQFGGTCLFLQGAAGNLGPRVGFTGDLAVYHRLGRILGLEAARVALELETLPREPRYAGCLESGAPIALFEYDPVEPPPAILCAISRMVPLPVRAMRPPEELEAEATQLRARLNDLRRTGSEDEIRYATAMATQAGMRADRARLVAGKSHLERRLMGIRIGSTALVSVQGEPFIEIANQVDAASPFPLTLFSGYSHGGGGYIPVPQAYEEGGYEVDTTLFAPEAAAILVAESLAVLRDLNSPKPGPRGDAPPPNSIVWFNE